MSASLSCPVTWAQRKDSLFVTLAISDVDAKTAKVGARRAAARRARATCRSHAPRGATFHAPLPAARLARSLAAQVELTAEKLVFSGTSNGKLYTAELVFFAPVNPTDAVR